MIDWMINNPELSITSAISIASIIARLTPTKTDNKIIFMILKLIDILAINNQPIKKTNGLK